jgi:hypothetical protein
MAGQAFTKASRDAVDKWGQDEIKRVLDEMHLGPQWFLPLLKNIAEKGSKDRDRLKAIDMIAKFGGLVPPERVFVTTSDAFKLEFGEADDE